LQDGGATISGSAGSVSMDFAGGRKAAGTLGRELPGKVNYLHGNDPRQWRIGLATYESVRFPDVYPGIDVVYRGNQRQMEFDLVLKPGADAGRIRLKFLGGEPKIDPDGALVVGELRIPLPTVYQEAAGSRQKIKGRYAPLANREVGFRLGPYDRSQPLVIDPIIVYSSLIGGGAGSTFARAIAVDSEGNAYIAGGTSASDLPTANAAYSQISGGSNGVVCKIDPTGSTLLYSTFLGGSGGDQLLSIALDSTGAAWVTGFSQPADP
jgi:hypothetical protein